MKEWGTIDDAMTKICAHEGRKDLKRRVATMWANPETVWAVKTSSGWTELDIRALKMPQGLLGTTVFREGDPIAVIVGEEVTKFPKIAKGLLIHELAHAISGKTSHGAEWRSAVRRLYKDLGEDVPFTTKSIKIAYEGRQ